MNKEQLNHAPVRKAGAVDKRKPFDKPQIKKYDSLPVITAGSVQIPR